MNNYILINLNQAGACSKTTQCYLQARFRQLMLEMVSRPDGGEDYDVETTITMVTLEAVSLMMVKMGNQLMMEIDVYTGLL